MNRSTPRQLEGRASQHEHQVSTPSTGDRPPPPVALRCCSGTGRTSRRPPLLSGNAIDLAGSADADEDVGALADGHQVTDDGVFCRSAAGRSVCLPTGRLRSQPRASGFRRGGASAGTAKQRQAHVTTRLNSPASTAGAYASRASARPDIAPRMYTRQSDHAAPSPMPQASSGAAGRRPLVG